MPPSAESDQDNADTGTGAEGANGAGSEGQQPGGQRPGDQDMVPRARLDQQIETTRRLETDLAELRGQVEGMKGQGANGGGEKTYSLAQLNEMVEDEKISQAEADRIYTEQQENRLNQMVDQRVTAALSSHDKKITAEAQIEKYAEALPDVMTDGTDTRAKFGTELNFLESQGHDRKKPETILLAMRAAFGPIERLGMNPGPGKREPMQDTNSAGETDEGGGGDKQARWPNWMSARQKEHYEKQISTGFYKDREDCLKRIERSFPTLKSAAARDKAAA